jgi:hypothetical protein
MNVNLNASVLKANPQSSSNFDPFTRGNIPSKNFLLEKEVATKLMEDISRSK